MAKDTPQAAYEAKKSSFKERVVVALLGNPEVTKYDTQFASINQMADGVTLGMFPPLPEPVQEPAKEEVAA